MTRTQAKELLPAIQHFANGGDLYHAMTPSMWCVQDKINTRTNSPTENIIKDKHFEARKAYALGREIVYYDFHSQEWIDCADLFLWDNDTEYRQKPPEPEYEWQWACREHGKYSLTDYYTQKEAMTYCKKCTKFEPSKRLKE